MRINIKQPFNQLLHKLQQLSTTRHQPTQHLCHVTDHTEQDISIALDQPLLEHKQLLELLARLLEYDRFSEDLVKLEEVLDAVDG